MARTNWKAKFEALQVQYNNLALVVALMPKVSALAAPKSAALVLVDGQPFFTALDHKAAYGVMRAVQARGRKAMYRPCH